MSKAAIIAIIVIIIIGGWWWYAHQSGMNPTTVTNTTNVINSTTTAATPPVVKEFTVTGSNFRFDPKSITVNKGDTVKITLVNGGGTHDLKIDEFGVATNILNGGEQQTVEFVADKVGTFEYYCSVGNHRAMGMWGTLTVK